MSSKRWFILLIGVVLAVGAFSLYSAETPQLNNSNEVASTTDSSGGVLDTTDLSEQDYLEKIALALQIIENQYVDEVDQTQLVEGAINGMLETLDDPYSDYMDQETAKQFEESLDSHFEGIGAEVSMVDGKVTIVAPIRDSPAERAGLQPNDQIIKIEGETIEGLSLNEAVLQIRGEKGTTVNLTIERPGATEPIEFAIVRDEIPIETIVSEMIEQDGKNIGYIIISSFSIDTAERFEEALTDLESQGLDGLVLDVRGNPGGYLNAVEKIGHLIVPGGEPIVQIENRSGEKERHISSLNETKPYPIVGITDGASASASEILSAALIEAGNYDVVGDTTFGKGTVQQTIPMGDGSQIKLSLFRWLTSGGNDIHNEGVEPTEKVMQPDYFYVPPITIQDEPLKAEMLNEQIKSAQAMLNGLGFDIDRDDGFFDEQTVSAVESFQKANGLEVSGEIDEETAAEMQNQIIEEVRDRANDQQLQRAIELAIEGSNE
ncbi:S41 family peptidase [Alkalihalobacillus pseudalcaliphilus]|uniref:S41 family peptidase n=1 Tax=Alkalihalobacillus pseudalcaliphilus TaxID=79884 RepID=UPI00064DFF6D|nr:S41 family peptidase [Alkalihalobacillus pseudalcaliphilus]KMK77455.1 peptidase S41 [Alkalihalobacillus pseudalcaliphilus]